MAKTNDLLHYFENNKGRLIHKCMHYFDIYEHHFHRFRGKKVKVLEIGVSHGGSLQMWKKYFGRKAEIFGIDIDPRCKNLEEKKITIFIGDQENKSFLKKTIKIIGDVDIIIEDGGHMMKQQVNTFEALYPHVKDGGIFLIEDLCTNYWDYYGGGYRKLGTFVEFSKSLVDQLMAWHSKDSESFKINDFTRTTKSMHFYDSIIVFEKGKIEEPSTKMTGKESF